ncbi:homoserine dehydrogenase [Alphaproteobacteria bacterium]|nr:homoserine dehydrogenase [Alphaproteobacteria bacterium]
MTNNKKTLKIAIAGLGTVGKGVYDILHKDHNIIEKRTNVRIEVVGVSSRTKKDFVNQNIKFYDDVIEMANDPQVDVVVELIGGKTIAKQLIFKAIANGKKVVTANKALIAEDGEEIANFVDKHQGILLYEASVAGANPIIKAFREGFCANDIKEVYGILNGTCNFILTKMRDEEKNYHETLKQAQELGYAEADPSFDVEGIDTAHKIAILSALANSSYPIFEPKNITGISKISADDIAIANELGYKIKLLAIYKNLGDKIQQSVYPALLKNNEKIAQVDGSYNAILTLGSNFEWNMMIGRGAGGLTTGSAVVADIIDIACQRFNKSIFNVDLSKLSHAKTIGLNERYGKYFLKFIINNEQSNQKNLIKEVFGEKIKIKQVTYKKTTQDQTLVALITESIIESDFEKVIAEVSQNLKGINFIRVEETKF